jgi:DNA topoisomerase-1
MNVVIVESPAKAKTINKYLGPSYKVVASYGHVRDLPPKDGSVEPDADFLMHWEVDADRVKNLRAIAEDVKGADRLILATDPDREGEAISWHLLEVLKGRKALPKGPVERVTFNEITKSAVTAAMARPRELDRDLIDAYLARRALDYLVGFTLSPVLWRKLPGARSAGRVQSVALRLIAAREMEIERFVARTYFTVAADMTTPGGQPFVSRLTHWRGAKLDKFDLATEEQAEAARADVAAGQFRIAGVETKPVMRHPAPPFTTSTLQQEAARKLGFSATQTMRVAQQLYEGISIGGETTGLITYMRTDGVQISGDAIGVIRGVISRLHGEAYVPDKPRAYATKAKNAQEAHEGIRPTDPTRLPREIIRGLSDDQFALYELIWQRAVASQMASAKLERTTVDLVDESGKATLRASGQVVLFPGFMAIYEEGRDETAEDDDSRRLPAMKAGERPDVKRATAERHVTEPPPRYSEASLVKKLEELGIGRPSTYASILQTLRDRDYVVMERNRFVPQDKGRLVIAFLENFFDRYVEYDFTADLETQLDDVSAGKRDWREVLRAFWEDFKPKTEDVLGQKTSDVLKAVDLYLEPHLFPERADASNPRACPSCGDGRLSLKAGKFGAFIGCSNYPTCRYTRPFGSGEGDQAAASEGPRVIGLDPATQAQVSLRSGRFGVYLQLGEDPSDGSKPPRASLPKDVPAETLTLDLALKLLSLPRAVGDHPETGKPITASIGRYGPYLAHDGKYARLKTTEDVLTIGMNLAVSLLAAERPGRPQRGAAASALKDLGVHPETGAAIRLLAGRYGPYVTDGTLNANIARGQDPADVTLEQALGWLAERAAKAPTKGKKPAARAKTAAKATTKSAAKTKAKPKPKAKKAPAKARPVG